MEAEPAAISRSVRAAAACGGAAAWIPCRYRPTTSACFVCCCLCLADGGGPAVDVLLALSGSVEGSRWLASARTGGRVVQLYNATQKAEVLPDSQLRHVYRAAAEAARDTAISTAAAMAHILKAVAEDQVCRALQAALPKEKAKKWSEDWVKGITEKLPRQLIPALAVSAAAVCVCCMGVASCRSASASAISNAKSTRCFLCASEDLNWADKRNFKLRDAVQKGEQAELMLCRKPAVFSHMPLLLPSWAAQRPACPGSLPARPFCQPGLPACCLISNCHLVVLLVVWHTGAGLEGKAKMWLDAGADPNAADPQTGYTALHLAAEQHNAELLQVCLALAAARLAAVCSCTWPLS